MTASSLQLLSSRRVQLIGLPHTSSGSATRTIPPASVVNQVSRNLFGTPDSREMSQMFQEHFQNERQRFIQRFDFDIGSLSSCEKNSKQHYFDPDSIIAKELAQHEQRLSEDKSNLIRDDQIPAMNKKIKQITFVKKTVGPVNADAGSATSALDRSKCNNCNNAASDRLKPYARQTLLTDCFNLRKSTPQCHSLSRSSSAFQRTANSAALLPVSYSSLQFVEVSHLSKPMNGVLSSGIIESPESLVEQIMPSPESPSSQSASSSASSLSSSVSSPFKAEPSNQSV